MRASVREVFALEVDARANAAREPLGEVERRRPAGVGALQPGKLSAEGGISTRGVVGALQLIQRGHQAFGHEASAEFAKAATGVGKDAVLVRGGPLLFGGWAATGRGYRRTR